MAMLIVLFSRAAEWWRELAGVGWTPKPGGVIPKLGDWFS